MTDEELIEIGKVSGAVGIRGEIKVYHYSGERERLAGVMEFFLETDGDPKPFGVKSMRYNGRSPVLALDGIEDRNSAEALRGRKVFVRPGDLPPPGEDEFYVRDLIGALVEDSEGHMLGRVTEIIDNPAHDILVVSPEGGEQKKNFMLPFVDVFILSVEHGEKGVPARISVKLPEGLLEAGA
jgi:16S rRNA processing protein RimM